MLCVSNSVQMTDIISYIPPSQQPVSQHENVTNYDKWVPGKMTWGSESVRHASDCITLLVPIGQNPDVPDGTE